MPLRACVQLSRRDPYLVFLLDFLVVLHLQSCTRDSTLRCHNSLALYSCSPAQLRSPEPTSALLRICAARAPAIPRPPGGCQRQRALPSAGLGGSAEPERAGLALDTGALFVLLLQGTARAATTAGCELLWPFGFSHCLQLTGALFLFVGALRASAFIGEHRLPSVAAKDQERHRR